MGSVVDLAALVGNQNTLTHQPSSLSLTHMEQLENSCALRGKFFKHVFYNKQVRLLRLFNIIPQLTVVLVGCGLGWGWGIDATQTPRDPGRIPGWILRTFISRPPGRCRASKAIGSQVKLWKGLNSPFFSSPMNIYLSMSQLVHASSKHFVTLTSKSNLSSNIYPRRRFFSGLQQVKI